MEKLYTTAYKYKKKSRGNSKVLSKNQNYTTKRN